MIFLVVALINFRFVNLVFLGNKWNCLLLILLLARNFHLILFMRNPKLLVRVANVITFFFLIITRIICGPIRDGIFLYTVPVHIHVSITSFIDFSIRYFRCWYRHLLCKTWYWNRIKLYNEFDIILFFILWYNGTHIYFSLFGTRNV